MIRKLVLGIAIALLVAGCGSGVDLQGTIGKGLVGPVTKGVFGLATADATTTLAWVDAQVAAGGLGAADAELAKACPTAVLEVAAIRDKLLNPPDVSGFKGLIYNATVARFGTPSGAAQAKAAAAKVLAACMDLAPSQILLGF